MSSSSNIEDIYPLAPMQSGILFEYVYNHSTTVYHEQNIYRFSGRLNAGIVETALSHLCSRHTILRTAFVHEEVASPLQVVLADRKIKFSHIRLEKTGDPALQLHDIRERDKQLRFNLAKDPLMRVSLVQVNENEFELVWTFHHIIMDGWCINLLLSEFNKIYTLLDNNQAVNLPAIQPYSRFIQFLSQTQKTDSLRYWKEYLEGYEETGSFLSDISEAADNSISRKKYLFSIEDENTQVLKNVCRQNNLTENVYLRTAWAVLISKYVRKRDIVFGTIVHGRPSALPDAAEMIGLFINNIPVRVKYDDTTSFLDLVKYAQDDLMASENHQYLSLAEIKGGGRKLFDNIFLFQHFSALPEEDGSRGNVSGNGIEMLNVSSSDNIPQDLLVLASVANGLSVEISYHPDIYDEQFIAGMAANLQYLLILFSHNVHLRIADFCLFSPDNVPASFYHEDIAEDHRIRSYWLTRFTTPVVPLELLQEGTVEGTGRNNITSVPLLFDSTTVAAVRRLSDEQVYSPLIILQAAVIILLYRYTGKEYIITGTPGVNGAVGAGMLPLNLQLNDRTIVKELLNQISNALEGAYRHQPYEVDRLLNDLSLIHPNLERSFFFDAVILLSDHDNQITAMVNDFFNSGMAHHTFICSFLQRENELKMELHYNTASFSPAAMKRLALHLEQLLLSLCENIQTDICSLRMLSTDEESQLIHDFNATDVPYPGDITLVDLLQRQLDKTPDYTAICFEGKQLTYRALHERANQLGNYLKEQGVQPETFVGICLDRSIEMVISILAVLKAGAAYMPIDPGYPVPRIRFMLEDSGCKMVITQSVFEHLFPEALFYCLLLDREEERLHTYSMERPSDIGLSVSHPAYLIYTSGSTGLPKGAINEHGGIVNRLLWMQEALHFTSADVILQKTTYCFDVSVWELLSPLLVGAKLVMAKPEGQKDTVYLQQIIKSEQISVIHFVPSMLQIFLEDMIPGECLSLSRVVCSGEPLTVHHVQLFRRKLPGVELYNLYGPTEAAIDVTVWSLPPGDVADINIVPIGKPIANTRLYILDNAGNLVPPGLKGELHIGGIQVARGYVNREELTAACFTADRFSPQPDARLYKTGDMARWMEDGSIEYLGRKDNQVKIRGYRIELGEIETALQQSGMVRQAVVLARRDHYENMQLVAYIVPGSGVNTAEMMAYLKQCLPAYMVPAHWVELEKIPLTSNGKIDKKGLPAPNTGKQLKEQYVSPRNETEERLAEIWTELLNIERVGVHDNFFVLGGHSLLAIRMASAIRKKLNAEISIKDIFQLTNIAQIASFLQHETEASGVEESDKYVTITL